MRFRIPPLLNISILMALGKGFSVFYFVLLPVFYAEKLITTEEIGIIGAIFIVLVIVGAIFVARSLHKLETKKLLQLSAVIAACSSVILLIGVEQKNLNLLLTSYAIMGVAVGTAMSGINALSAQATTRGNRFKSFAMVSMSMDIVRIVFPLVVSGAIILGNSTTAILFIIIVAIILFIFSSIHPSIATLENEQTSEVKESVKNIISNKNFLYVLVIEFFDSFASSQLFVFLPLLFLAKGYPLESSLLLQSFIFLGYIAGRWFVSFLAKMYSGVRAISYAEIGMVVAIILLLVVQNIWMLYVLSFILGIFTRGTSPAIKALAFDTLNDAQVKRGSAIHVVAGDSGSALGQLIFGYLIAWLGVNSPFIAAAIVALLIGVLCFIRPVRINKVELA